MLKSLRIALAAAALPGLMTGCAGFTGSTNKTAAARPAKPTEDFAQVIANLNANSQQIQSIRCDHVDVDGKAEGQVYTVNAKMAFQRDNSFRLVGRFAGKSEIDLGSNDQEIWFWIARATPPAVYFCKRDELADIRLNTPFQPDWLVEVLGAAQLDPKKFEMERSTPEYFTLVADERTPNGMPVIKRIVIDRKTSRIAGYELFASEQGNKKLFEAWVQEYYEDPTTKVFLPRKVRLEWPEANTNVTVSLRSNKILVNSITPELAESLFRRGEYLNTEVVDLARFDPSSRQSSGAQKPRGDLTGRSREKVDSNVRPVGASLTGGIEPQSTARQTPPLQIGK